MTGDYICLLCGFRLHKRLLRASDEVVGVSITNHNEETSDLCPNDGSELVVELESNSG